MCKINNSCTHFRRVTCSVPNNFYWGVSQKLTRPSKKKRPNKKENEKSIQIFNVNSQTKYFLQRYSSWRHNWQSLVRDEILGNFGAACKVLKQVEEKRGDTTGAHQKKQYGIIWEFFPIYGDKTAETLNPITCIFF